MLKIPLSEVLFLRLAFPWHFLQGNLDRDETSPESTDVLSFVALFFFFCNECKS